MKGGKAPTVHQKHWWDWLVQQGCYLGLGEACIHHCVGSTARHNKVEIGNWWVIPLSYEAHQGPGGIHGDLSLFEGDRRKDIEKEIFAFYVERYRRQFEWLPVPADVLMAIEGYRR